MQVMIQSKMEKKKKKINCYRRGRAKEYYYKSKMEKEGNIVIRSAGSHSFTDLIVISKKDMTIRFVQCKSRGLSKPAKEKLEQEYSWLNTEFVCSYEVLGGKK